MGGAQFTIPLIQVVPGQLITAQLWLNEWNNLAQNLNPSGMDGYMDTTTQAQIQTNPYPSNILSLAGSMGGELERIRYQIWQMMGGANVTPPYWYAPPPSNLAALANTILPLGAVIDYHSSTPPNANFLLANGQAIGRSAYASLNALYSAASYPFGNGDGTTTFNLPNYNDRISMGVNSTLPTPGATAGNTLHTLVAAELPAVAIGVIISDPGHNHSQNAHTHTATDSGHTHIESYQGGGTGGSVPTVVSKGVAGTSISPTTIADGSNTATQSGIANVTNANTVATNNAALTGITSTTQNLGTSTPHSILNPVIGMYKLIRVL